MSAEKREVLDHGYIRLVDHMGSDLSVVRAARVSHDADWRAGENEGSDKKLIKFLWKHGHTTPFEAVEFQFEVMAPIFVLRQWQRHRTMSFNELSARYRPLPELFYVPKHEDVGEQDTKNKQGRNLDRAAYDPRKRQGEVNLYRTSCRAQFGVYKMLLDEGWPRELARAVLPLSTYSHMFAKMNLLNAFKFIALRADQHAQMEIRVYAEAMKELIRPIVPVCVEAFDEARGT